MLTRLLRINGRPFDVALIVIEKHQVPFEGLYIKIMHLLIQPKPQILSLYKQVASHLIVGETFKIGNRTGPFED